MKRRNFLKGLLAVPAVLAGCKAATMPSTVKGPTIEDIKAVSAALDAQDVPTENRIAWSPGDVRWYGPDGAEIYNGSDWGKA